MSTVTYLDKYRAVLRLIHFRIGKPSTSRGYPPMNDPYIGPNMTEIGSDLSLAIFLFWAMYILPYAKLRTQHAFTPDPRGTAAIQYHSHNIS